MNFRNSYQSNSLISDSHQIKELTLVELSDVSSVGIIMTLTVSHSTGLTKAVRVCNFMATTIFAQEGALVSVALY